MIESAKELSLELMSFDVAPPVFAGCDGLVATHVEERRLELVIVGFGEAHEKEFAAMTPQPLSVEVVELNLEDAFIEYTRGSRRALPVFAE